MIYRWWQSMLGQPNTGILMKKATPCHVFFGDGAKHQPLACEVQWGNQILHTEALLKWNNRVNLTHSHTNGYALARAANPGSRSFDGGCEARSGSWPWLEMEG
jgi:hypothetical protein